MARPHAERHAAAVPLVGHQPRDPRKDYSFERFFKDSKYEKCYPLPLEVFIDYRLWFQQRAVPDVDETYVSSIERQGDQSPGFPPRGLAPDLL